MVKEKFQGTGTALVTPFNSDGEVDSSALARIVDFQLDNGIDMIFPCGTTGESPTLEQNEWERIVSLILERVDHRVPVIVGAGSNSTAHAVAITKQAARLGADGVLSVGPYYNKPQQDGYYQHFKAVAEAVDIPIILYNVPPRTGSNIHAQTTLRLAELPGVVAVKEASGSLDQVAEILRHRPRDFRVLSGDDPLTLPMISMGADGVVSVTSNEVPGMFTAMVDFALTGDVSSAQEIHFKLLRLMRANFIETSPAPVKAVLDMMGFIEEGCRLPLVRIREGTRDELREAAAELGLLD